MSKCKKQFQCLQSKHRRCPGGAIKASNFNANVNGKNTINWFMTTIITFYQISLKCIYSSILFFFFWLRFRNSHCKLNTPSPKRRSFTLYDQWQGPLVNLPSVVSCASVLGEKTYSLLLEPFSCKYTVWFHVEALKYTPGLAALQVELLAHSSRWIQSC